MRHSVIKCIKNNYLCTPLSRLQTLSYARYSLELPILVLKFMELYDCFKVAHNCLTISGIMLRKGMSINPVL